MPSRHEGHAGVDYSWARNVKAGNSKYFKLRKYVFSLVCCAVVLLIPFLMTTVKRKPWSSSCVLRHISTASNVCAKSHWNPPRCFLVYDHTIFHVFEDWVEPFLYALAMTLEVIKLSVKSERESTMFHSILKAGDTVLFLQSSHNIVRKNGIEYWFLNTEGPDKGFAELALSHGYKRMIDYSSFNAERHKLGGAEMSLWLPLVGSHSVTHRSLREKLCMVGGVNTARRERFVQDFDENVRKRGMNVSIQHVIGWGHTRDFSSQTCALVVNVASLENNHATPRLRLDKLWQFDIQVISEQMSGNETHEYNGTVLFFPLSELPNATLNLWESIMHDNDVGSKVSGRGNVELMKARIAVQESRMARFQHVVQTVTRRALEVHAMPHFMTA